MTFGVATLGTQVKRTGARTFDCGRHGELTARQIASKAKITKEAVWARVNSGVTGADLCAPKHDGLRKVRVKCSRSVVVVAMKLARKYPDRVPTLKQIRRVHPMGERNAMRWRQAMKETLEKAA